jgi:REP element-mobilizing transposase RayT
MARRPRSELPAHGVFHITARGVDRRAIFVDDDDRRSFLALVDVAVERFGWRILAYCLMTNHFHVVVIATLPGVSNGMQLLNGRYAQDFNRRHARTGHLFQGRFHARAVEDDGHLERVCDYVLDNAVRAGLCEERAQWPWLGGALAA